MKRFFALSVIAIAGHVTGCSTAEETQDQREEEVVAAPPAEPSVFAASEETKAELGIVKWGVAVEDATETTTFRGYGAKNEVVATVVQRFVEDASGVDTWTMTMTSPTESASERIEFYVKADSETEGKLWARVIENTFDATKTSGRVLARFKIDSGGGGLAGASGSLVGGAGDELVSRCRESALTCQAPLIDARSDASQTAEACGVTPIVVEPLLTCVGAALVTGPAAAKACLAAGGVVLGYNTIQCLRAIYKARGSRKEFLKCDSKACAQ